MPCAALSSCSVTKAFTRNGSMYYFDCTQQKQAQLRRGTKAHRRLAHDEAACALARYLTSAGTTYVLLRGCSGDCLVTPKYEAAEQGKSAHSVSDTSNLQISQTQFLRI